MKIINAQAVADALPFDALIDALDAAFVAGANTPDRGHHEIEVPGVADGTLLLMPCWQTNKNLGVKIATVFPGNVEKALSAVHASYFLMDAGTGVPIAVLDGTELTRRRTAAASALASRYLSRTDSSTLLMVGTGELAPHLVAAHASARDIGKVLIWGRREEAARALKEKLTTLSVEGTVVTKLEAAVTEADIISCATLAKNPLIKGEWLRAGQHLDLVGAFKPDMREADATAVSRAEVYVDTYGGAMSEAGDILQAIQENAFEESDIAGDLAELANGKCQGRTSEEAITLFKSVGTALEDLAAAELVMRNHNA
jgi:ornithine cyclodeaminase